MQNELRTELRSREAKSFLQALLDDLLKVPEEKRGFKNFLLKAWWEGAIVDTEEDWATKQPPKAKHEILRERLEAAAMAWAKEEARKAGGTFRKEGSEEEALGEEGLGYVTQSFLETLLLERGTVPDDILESLSTLVDQHDDDPAWGERQMSNFSSVPLPDTSIAGWFKSAKDAITSIVPSRELLSNSASTGRGPKEKLD